MGSQMEKGWTDGRTEEVVWVEVDGQTDGRVDEGWMDGQAV